MNLHTKQFHSHWSIYESNPNSKPANRFIQQIHAVQYWGDKNMDPQRFLWIVNTTSFFHPSPPVDWVRRWTGHIINRHLLLGTQAISRQTNRPVDDTLSDKGCALRSIHLRLLYCPSPEESFNFHFACIQQGKKGNDNLERFKVILGEWRICNRGKHSHF